MRAEAAVEKRNSSREPKRLSILYVAYPLLMVTENSAGGAEQMLLTLEREMARAGHRTTVAAADGSQVGGRMLATGPAAKADDQFEQRERRHNAAILEYLSDHPGEFDLIHDESGSFFRLAEDCPVPVLATLHLPRSFYPAEYFRQTSPRHSFNCVSAAQAASFGDLPRMLGAVPNGIAIERFPFTPNKQDYLLWLGRICEEKAPHLAIAAAGQAGLPLVLAGQVYPFRYHQEYFAREILPALADGANVRFVDRPSFAQKLELLRYARALLLTSTVEETSSLVAMEAMACGTPVAGFRRTAFAEVVAQGETGFLLDSLDEMPAAIENSAKISPQACRTRAEQFFTAKRMADDYEALYRTVLARAAEAAAA